MVHGVDLKMILRICWVVLACFVYHNFAQIGDDYSHTVVTHSGIVCEGDTFIAECADDESIKWEAAEYKTQLVGGRCSSNITASPRHCQPKTVLDIVRQSCNEKNMCNFTVEDSLFKGDPCDGVYMTVLEVTYTCGGNPAEYHSSVCDYDYKPVGCRNGNMSIISAVFKADINVGRDCGATNTHHTPVDCLTNSTEYVSQRCNNHLRCIFGRFSALFGDPCADVFHSQFEYRYSCYHGNGIKDLTKVRVTTENVQEVADALANIIEGSNENSEAVDLADVQITLENVVGIRSSSSNVTDSVVRAVNAILFANISSSDQESSKASSDILQSLEQQVSNTIKQHGKYSSTRPNIAVEGVTVGETQLSGGIGFTVGQTDAGFSVNDSRIFDPEKAENVGISIQLPRDALFEYTINESEARVNFIAYSKDKLFQSEVLEDLNVTMVVGPILSAAVLGREVAELDEPVILQIETNLVDEVDPNAVKCVYWNFSMRDGIGDWAEDGCELISAESRKITCHCDHLTNFAVLVYHGEKIINSKALDVVSKIGCYISLVALIVTIITLILVRRFKLKNSRGKTGQTDMGHNAHYFMILMCITLSAVYVVFLAAIDRTVLGTVPVSGCTVAAALLHYFVLATMVSTAVQARYMYTKLVTWQKYAGGREPNLVLKATAVTFGIPAIIVAVSLGVDHRRTGFKAYNNEHYCFPKVGWIVYFAVLLPIAIVLIHNLISAGWIIKKGIFRSRFPGQRAGGNDSDKYELIERLRKSTAISCVLGLSCIFGFFAIDEATLPFQWLFTIFNSLQGLLIFIFFCLTSRDVRATIIKSTPCSSCINYINTASLWTETSNISQSKTGKDGDTVSIDNIEMSKPQGS